MFSPRDFSSADFSAASEYTPSVPPEASTSDCAGNFSARYWEYFDTRTTVPPSSSTANSSGIPESCCSCASSAEIPSGVPSWKSAANSVKPPGWNSSSTSAAMDAPG